MGELANRVNSVKKNRGGQPNQLKQFLQEHPELIEDFRTLLGNRASNLPELRRIMWDDYDFQTAPSTWNKWSIDYRSGQLGWLDEL